MILEQQDHVAHLAPLVHALYVGVQHLLVVLSSEETIFAPGRNLWQTFTKCNIFHGWKYQKHLNIPLSEGIICLTGGRGTTWGFRTSSTLENNDTDRVFIRGFKTLTKPKKLTSAFNPLQWFPVVHYAFFVRVSFWFTLWARTKSYVGSNPEGEHKALWYTCFTKSALCTENYNLFEQTKKLAMTIFITMAPLVPSCF